jgi:uncharacterized protein YndB with AHSA1/START domain
MNLPDNRDVVPGQVEVTIPDGRVFAVIRGRRWTRVAEYLSNGQLTARWFYDEATGEAREAEGWRKPRKWRMGEGHMVSLIVEEAYRKGPLRRAS